MGDGSHLGRRGVQIQFPYTIQCRDGLFEPTFLVFWQIDL